MLTVKLICPGAMLSRVVPIAPPNLQLAVSSSSPIENGGYHQDYYHHGRKRRRRRRGRWWLVCRSSDDDGAIVAMVTPEKAFKTPSFLPPLLRFRHQNVRREEGSSFLQAFPLRRGKVESDLLFLSRALKRWITTTREKRKMLCQRV